MAPGTPGESARRRGGHKAGLFCARNSACVPAPLPGMIAASLPRPAGDSLQWAPASLCLGDGFGFPGAGTKRGNGPRFDGVPLKELLAAAFPARFRIVRHSPTGPQGGRPSDVGQIQPFTT